jgi:Fe2+ or Zn2+ uptake regulation protein
MQTELFRGAYFNTTRESGAALRKSQEVCGRQESIIAGLFQDYRALSPSQVHKLYPDKGTPLTSIRRAISVLTDKGILIKTESKMQGEYGKPEYIWKLK